MSNADLKTGWLCPNGDFYPCETFDHISCAREIVKDDTTPRPDEILHDCGFAEITISPVGEREWQIFWKHFLSDAQKNFLRPYFEDETRPMEYRAKMRWEQENRT